MQSAQIKKAQIRGFTRIKLSLLRKRSCEGKGFTLIELLVAISIVAILSSIGLASFSGIQARSRDTKRIRDLQEIKKALSLYYTDNRSYPPSCGGWCYSNGADPWIPSLTFNYMGKIPTDPKANGGTPWVEGQYGYAYWSIPAGTTCGTFSAGEFFLLITELENRNDSLRNEVQDYRWCDGNGLRTTHGYSRYAYIVTSL